MRVTRTALTIGASPENVWDAITRPEFVRRWQYDSDLITDWIVDEPIRFRAEWRGQVLEQWGTVLEFRPPTRLRYSLFAPRPGLEDQPENYFTVTYELEEMGEATLVTFIQEDPREADIVEDSSGDDNPVMNALRTVAESLANE